MVDIIIPIYNAYDAVKECIDSIFRNTDLLNNRLILINDCSSDEKIVQLLNKIEIEHHLKNIIVMHNEKNLGFVGTVNKGMKFSSNDVVLLNSDTEVPKRWIENLQKCAYSQPDVATVTALSNNATLASVPKGLQPNQVPSFFSFEEYAECVEDHSFTRYPQIPTAHGFCMYIRRDILSIVGYFDEEAFGKGYGEENDFSYRCMDYGFKHLLCDNVLVYHKESQSFNQKKEELIKHNMEILVKRYPSYVKNTSNWCANFPIKDICENVDYCINSYNRSNILYLIHDWSNIENNVGGTTLHCKDLIHSLRALYNIHVLAPENGRYKLYSYYEFEDKVLYLDKIEDNGMRSLYDADYRKMLVEIVDGLGISLVHVHHMIGHYFDVIDVCKSRNVRALITLHDFYSLCPTVNMLYKDSFCLNLDKKNCEECISQKKGIRNNIIPIWRVRWIDFLKKFDRVIVPSESTRFYIEKELKGLDCLVIEHGVDMNRQHANHINNLKIFNVAFVGVMTKHKGSDVLTYLIKNSKEPNIHFHLFGDSMVDDLKKNFKNYTYHGKYSREKLPELLKQNDIHLVCNLSIWAETYSYTLTETINSGVPVLSYNLGAVAERIKKYSFGWVLNDQDPNGVLKKIISISKHLDEYNNCIDAINNYKVKSIQEMKNDYVDLYNGSLPRKNSPTLLLNLLKKDEAYSKLQEIEKESIYINSLRWRLMKKIKVPKGLSSIVKIIRK